MVKNNILIKINDKIADYDDNTAIGITYNAFNPSEIDKIFLTTTNEFSLPITLNNKKIFDFAENPNSNPKSVYDKMPCYIYQDGVSVLCGDCYVSNVNDRYNVQFVEGKTVYDKLRDLPISKAQHIGIEDDSLAARVGNYWNTNVPYLASFEYGAKHQTLPTNAKQWTEAVMLYANVLKADKRNPANEFVVPLVNNTLYETAVDFRQIGTTDAHTTGTYENDFDTTSESYSRTNGFVISDLFTVGGEVKYDSAKQGWFVGEDYPGSLDGAMSRIMLVSPIWVRLDVVFSVLSEYTGYTITMYDKIKDYIGDREQFLFMPGLEFDFKFNAGWTGPTIQDGETEFLFEGKTRMVKGGPSGDCIRNGDKIEYIPLDYFGTANCLDLIKLLCQDLCLVPMVDNINKTLTFKHLSDIKIETPAELVLVEEKSKKFSIDNTARFNYIRYKNDSDNYNTTRLVCESDNIDFEKDILTIDRNLFTAKEYLQTNDNNETTVLQRVIDTSKTFTGITFGIPVAGWNEWELTDKLSIPDGMYLTRKISYGNHLFTNVAFHPLGKGLLNNAEYCNVISDLGLDYVNYLYNGATAKDVNSYEYFSEILYKPTVEEITVKKDLVFLHNWKNLRKVHIKGMTGNWYVQEISKFNPRTDDKMTLKVVKLPYDFEVYYTLSLSVSPENSGIVTGAGDYASGELVRVTATPNDGWYFKKWSDDVLSNIRDVYMDSDKNLTAMFEKQYIQDGLVLWLDESDFDNGIWIDRINNLSFVGNATKSGIGVDFNNNRLTCTTPFNLPDYDSTTFEVCFKKDNVGYGYAIFMANDIYKMFFTSHTSSGGNQITPNTYVLDKKPAFSIDTTKLFNSISLQSNTMLVDGLTSTPVTSLQLGAGYNNYMHIGMRANNTWPFVGKIYQIRIYNRLLTDEERLWNTDIDMKYNV